jgi:hypothetical protein
MERRTVGMERPRAVVDSGARPVETGTRRARGTHIIMPPHEGSNVMVKLLASVGLSLLLASTAATAAPSDKPAKPVKPAERQYCIKFADDTGSHLTRLECRTKKEWRQLGVDVDEVVQS